MTSDALSPNPSLMPIDNTIDFQNRLVVIATTHRKELVIAPILQTSLGVKVTVPQDFDSDRYGTFTRDIDRPANQIETAKIKAEKALEIIDADLAIASEGAFFPHPMLGIAYNREIILLLDQKHNFTVYGESLSADTNFCHQTISSYEQAYDFALKIGFPDHAVVLMPDAKTSAKESIYKGINSEKLLQESVDELLRQSSQIHIETDMRALCNPTRMKNITKATEDLVRKLHQLCPNCNFVNFDIVETIKGLPCELCGLPTPSPRAHLYQCDRCNFQQEIAFPDGSRTTNPMYCNYCNP